MDYFYNDYFYKIVCNYDAKFVEFIHIDSLDFLEKKKPSERVNWRRINGKTLSGDKLFAYRPTNICQFTSALARTRLVKTIDGYDYCINMVSGEPCTFDDMVKLFGKKCVHDTARGTKSLLLLCNSIRDDKAFNEELNKEYFETTGRLM